MVNHCEYLVGKDIAWRSKSRSCLDMRRIRGVLEGDDAGSKLREVAMTTGAGCDLKPISGHLEPTDPQSLKKGETGDIGIDGSVKRRVCCVERPGLLR